MHAVDQNLLGTQPVGALKYNILAWFEGKYPEFRQELKDVCKNYNKAGQIDYCCDEVPVKTPFVKCNGVIVLHETFLSYIWALSYAFMVIFDEDIHGPQTGQQPDHRAGLGHFVDKGYKVGNYGLSLLKEFQKWPRDLPNPENDNKSDKFYIEKTNGIYVAAVDFILCHELAHLACDHFKKLKEISNKSKKKEFEKEADLWALNCVQKGIRDPDRPLATVGFGAIVGMGSILFLESDLTSFEHPDTDERIANILTGLPIDDLDNLWGIAAAFFLFWQKHFNVNLNISSEYAYYKELFQDIVCQLQPSERNVGDEKIC